MTYWRTTRLMSGAQPSAGSPHSAYTTRADLIPFPSRPSLELSKISEPSPDEFEPGSYLLFFAILLGPAICVFGAVLLYLALIA